MTSRRTGSHAGRCTIRFHGHACFTVTFDDGPRLLLDPCAAGGLGGAVTLRAPTGPWDAVLVSHEHEDHAAVHLAGGAPVLATPGRLGSLVASHRLAAHDEHGGRLRGGLVRMLDLRCGGLRVVHASDLGERPDGETLAWLRTPRIDVLLAPAGGYFTLGPDGFAELVERAAPRVTVPCHMADHGVQLPQLLPSAALRERLRAWSSGQEHSASCQEHNAHGPELTYDAGAPPAEGVWWLTPDCLP